MTTYSHSFDLPANPDAVFPLFTPKGEELWVPDWKPDYIDPLSGETQPDMVFRTGGGEEATIWICLAFDFQHRHARYLRMTPASRIAFVDVRCRAVGGGTEVAVQYRYVPLGPAGFALLHEMTPEGFAAMIEQWRDLILRNDRWPEWSGAGGSVNS